MGTLGAPQVIQVILITVVFVIHLFTFYDLSLYLKGDMVIFETTVYSIYFVIVIGYVIAIVSDGNFAPPLEAMAKLYGAILFNILGLITLKFYADGLSKSTVGSNQFMFGLIKSVCSLAVCVLFYFEMFQA